MNNLLPLNKIIQGDTLLELKKLPANFVDTIITSPPYWGLRDYGVKGQIGLEKTLDEFIEKLLTITAELKRILKPTGVMFWNHGDCYGGSGMGTWKNPPEVIKSKEVYHIPYGSNVKTRRLRQMAKCLMLQNYRLIIQMINQGWILRNTIIWHKPNHMPSSVKDRFSNSYEPVFMLVKRKKYWFDLDAVRIAHTTFENRPPGVVRKRIFNYRVRDAEKKAKMCPQFKASKAETERYKKETGKIRGGGANLNLPGQHSLGKNPGDVWNIPTQPFPEAHFATFPEKLIEPMILSSCPKEICKKCGKARVRIVKKEEVKFDKCPKCKKEKQKRYDICFNCSEELGISKGLSYKGRKIPRNQHWKKRKTETIGWTNCKCKAGWKAGIILDPFIGSGTVAIVAKRHMRDYLGIELNPDYIKIIRKRIRGQPVPLL